MNNMNLPAVEVESADGTREVMLATRHFMDRKIFLNGQIDSNMANEFLAQMLFLEKEQGKPITIYINSPGGEVNAGLMIYDIIQGSGLKINIVCTGSASSMAAIILAGGQKGRRYILRHSRVMIHEPLMTNGFGGSASSIESISKSILEVRDIANGIIAKHTGKTLEEVNEATKFDNFMSADEAVEFGICDSITDSACIGDE